MNWILLTLLIIKWQLIWAYFINEKTCLQDEVCVPYSECLSDGYVFYQSMEVVAKKLTLESKLKCDASTKTCCKMDSDPDYNYDEYDTGQSVDNEVFSEHLDKPTLPSIDNLLSTLFQNIYGKKKCQLDEMCVIHRYCNLEGYLIPGKQQEVNYKQKQFGQWCNLSFEKCCRIPSFVAPPSPFIVTSVNNMPTSFMESTTSKVALIEADARCPKEEVCVDDIECDDEGNIITDGSYGILKRTGIGELCKLSSGRKCCRISYTHYLTDPILPSPTNEIVTVETQTWCNPDEICVNAIQCDANNNLLKDASNVIIKKTLNEKLCKLSTGKKCCKIPYHLPITTSPPPSEDHIPVEVSVQCKMGEACVEDIECDDKGNIITDGSYTIMKRLGVNEPCKQSSGRKCCRIPYTGSPESTSPSPTKEMVPIVETQVWCLMDEVCVNSSQCGADKALISDASNAILRSQGSSGAKCMKSFGETCCKIPPTHMSGITTPSAVKDSDSTVIVQCNLDEACVSYADCDIDANVIKENSIPTDNIGTLNGPCNVLFKICCKMPSNDPPENDSATSITEIPVETQILCQLGETCVEAIQCDANNMLITDASNAIMKRMRGVERCDISSGKLCCQVTGPPPPTSPSLPIDSFTMMIQCSEEQVCLNFDECELTYITLDALRALPQGTAKVGQKCDFLRKICCEIIPKISSTTTVPPATTLTDACGIIDCLANKCCRLNEGSMGTTTPRTASNPIQCEDGQECVPPHICDSNQRIIVDGAGVIDARNLAYNTAEKSHKSCQLMQLGSEGVCCFKPNQGPKKHIPCPQGSICQSTRSCKWTNGSNNKNQDQECYDLLGEKGICCYESDEELPDPAPNSTGSLIFPNPTDCGQKNAHALIYPLDAKRKDALFGEFPWVAIIFKKNYLFQCAATIISEKHLLTAAHCVEEFALSPGDIFVRVGDYQLDKFDEPLPVEDLTINYLLIHEKYVKKSNKNGIALLVLKKPLELKYHINSVCLPDGPYSEFGPLDDFTDDFHHQECYLAGWGKDSIGGSYTSRMKKLKLPLLSHNHCQDLLRKSADLNQWFILDKKFLCAGGQPGLDACTGDGGAPLVCWNKRISRFDVVGLASWGLGCGQYAIPGVYINVKKFMPWIKSHLNK